MSIERAKLVRLTMRIAIAIASGLGLAVLAPPLNWHLLHWIAYLPMFWALDPKSDRTNLLLGYLYGVAAVAAIFFWIADTITLFSNIPQIGAIGILILFSAVFGAPYLFLWTVIHPLRRRFGIGWVLAAPALQVVIEFLSSYVLLFPYQQGVSQYQVPQIFQLASITGIWGISFLVVFINAALAEIIYRRREGGSFPARTVSGASLALSCVIIFSTWRYEAIEASLRSAPTLRVAQIQSGMSMVERINTSPKQTFKFWYDQTAAIPANRVDLVVWPEGASPYSLQGDKAAKTFSELARGKFEMVIGGGARERIQDGTKKNAYESFNSVYFIDRNGGIGGRYDKMVPLPFGEYMPLVKSPLGFLVDWIEGPGDFRAGTHPVVLEGSKWRFATPICYEAILPDICRSFSNPDLLVTVTNDAWFGDTASPHQHAMLAAIRSTELGIPMIRSAYTGVSFVVEPHGYIHSTTQPFTDVANVVTLRMGKFQTIYAKFGNWFVYVCITGLISAYIISWRSHVRSDSQ